MAGSALEGALGSASATSEKTSSSSVSQVGAPTAIVSREPNLAALGALGNKGDLLDTNRLSLGAPVGWPCPLATDNS
jgi:hypothetical protein